MCNVEFDFMGSFQKMGVHIFRSAQLRQLGALQNENKSIGMMKLYRLFCVQKKNIFIKPQVGMLIFLGFFLWIISAWFNLLNVLTHQLSFYKDNSNP